MKRISAFLITCCLISMSHKLLADGKDDSGQAAVRPITYTTADSIVRTYVKISSKDIVKCSDNIFYYWEKNGNILQNQGSFSGNVLHGKYIVTNADGLMITEGYFFNGTRDKYWKKWDTKGILIRSDLWMKGRLKKTELHSNGTMIEEISHRKNGKPQKKLDYTSGKKNTYIYKNNIWFARRKLNLFSKKQKQIETDSLKISFPNE